MKVAPLLAQYLYSNKRLDLTGIGTFLLDHNLEIQTENSRQQKPTVLDGVSFEPNSNIREQPELVAFISAHAGKIKALAAADLESHLELAKQFLNIGKPFLFEGIGTLSRIKGEYTFTPGLTLLEPAREQASRNTTPYEEQPADYKEVLYLKKKVAAWKKPAMLLLAVAGIGLAIWGGYKVYKNSGNKSKVLADSSGQQIDKKVDNATANVTTDTTGSQPANYDTATPAPKEISPLSGPMPAGMWKFVVETADKARALKRFAKLQTIGVKSVQMETRDSVTFKIYFALPASVADTSHILDSLRRNYTPAGSSAYVEK